MFFIETQHRFPLLSTTNESARPEILVTDATPIQLAMTRSSIVPKPMHITCIVGALADGSGWELMHEIMLVISLYFQNGLKSLTLLKPSVWDVKKYAPLELSYYFFMNCTFLIVTSIKL